MLSDRSPTVGTGLKFSVNGSRPSNNNFMLDGVNMADSGNSTPGGATRSVTEDPKSPPCILIG